MLSKRICNITFSVLLAAGVAGSTMLSVRAESSAPPTSAGKADKQAESAYRLPDSVIPSHYSLEFEPTPEKGTFTGKEVIELTLKKTTNKILMNANDLLVSDASLVSTANKKGAPLQVVLDKGLERVAFISAKTIAPGKYELHCSFKGSLNDKLRGFYRSTFKDKNGKTHYLSVTQMEPTDARRMFACFDEPAFKAAFKVKAIIPAENAAISNAPVEKESIDKASGRKIVEFETSPPMSTYLFALLIGEFKPTEPLESEGIPIRVWSVQHDPSMGNYARDHAGKLLTYLNSYFRIPYPWKKLDLIAIPDFQAGAMENPGAITFREKFLLADEKSSLSTKQDTVSITAHEMAHLWFGDLVTMKWWDDIWLNEAFATWMSQKAVDNIMPEWNVMSEFFSRRLGAFYTDSLHSTRSIQSPVIKPEDAEQMFDEITYVKGASVLRMLEHFLSEKIFQDGVSAYLKDHSFNNATTNDLWSALQAASNKPVKEIMDTWCKQPGYPVMTISDATGNVKAKQERFLLDGSKSGSQLWKVPVGCRELAAQAKTDSYGREEINPQFELISANEATLKAKPDSLIANAGGFGFYRTAYSGALDKKVLDKLKFMSAAERLTFLSDHAALSTSGKISVQEYLEVLKSYRNEKDYAVWQCISECLRRLDGFVQPAQRQAYAHFVRSLLKDEFERLGWENKPDEPAPTRLTRSLLIDILGTIGQDQSVVAKARQIFQKYVQSPAGADADLLDAITDTVAYNGGKKEFDTFKSLWKNATTPEVEHRNLFALSKFRQKDLIEAGLMLTISKELRAQDAPKLLAEFFNENSAKELAWNFMKNHWSQITQLYAPHMLAKLAAAPATLVTESSYKDAKAFFATHKVPDGASSISRMLEKLHINSLFNKRSGQALNKWLSAQIP